MKGVISKVRRNSLAAAAGIKRDEKLCAVNGAELHDIIEFSYLAAEEKIQLTIEDTKGLVRQVEIEKLMDEDIGLEFESAVFDEVTCCQNKCVFCFVDQMIPGMRQSLYVRDDDFRLSFLYGNFITLTNLQKCDYERIVRTHMSPLYVSIHATDSEVRRNMMKNKYAGDILVNLKRLINNGISVHTQIVLCPEFNDGAVLEKTFADLFSLAPMVETMAVVPVGLTKNRKDLPQVRLFTPEEAQKIIEQVDLWQIMCRQKIGKGFIYLGDEFYILAGMPIPPAENYDGFPQIENGIGLSRNFLDEWDKAEVSPKGDCQQNKALIPVGESAYKLLKPLVEDFNEKYGTKHLLLPVVNHFFGTTINVTGLLTGSDILTAVADYSTEYSRIILPEIVLNKDLLFLDDMSLADFKNLYSGEVQCAANASQLKQLLLK